MNAADVFARLPIPIIQAPMVGASSFEMALAVSRAGGLGTLAAGASAPEEIEDDVRRFRASAEAPFAVNLMVTRFAGADAGEVDRALERLAPWHAALGLPAPAAPNVFAQDFDAQLAALVRAAPPVASFTFERLRPAEIAALKAAGSLVVGTATTVAEARSWAEAGADAICAQGFEAGGHRGHFLQAAEASLVGTMALVPAIRAAVGLPVIAAGGIMDGRGIAAALALGAAAVQMGTAFLLAEESVANETWKEALRRAPDDPTRLTRAFTGRHARGVENRFMQEMRAEEDRVPAYPVQNRLTQPLRAASALAGDPDAISLWAGQGVKAAREGPAAALLQDWWREAQAASEVLAVRTGRAWPLTD